MRADIDGVRVEILGDPHLGKRFVHGVPLHRRGEREESVRQDVLASLRHATNADLHVCLGDLFDRAVVPYETITFAADAYLKAVDDAPDARFVVLRGNHDQGRDEEAVTAFDLFARMVEGAPNVEVIRKPERLGFGTSVIAFVPWNSTGSLEGDVHALDGMCDAAFFHADTDPRNGPENLIPTKALAELGIGRAFTGHVHKPQGFLRDGVQVTVVGSLQPLAFGEEVDDSLYVTVTKDQVGPHLRDKVVRVDLRPGEARDVELDCLQLVYRSADEAQEDVKVELGELDLARLTGEVLAENGIGDAVRLKVLDHLANLRMR